MEDCDLRLSVEFFDNYSSDGFWFKDRTSNRRFCIAMNGEQDRGCLPNFVGSVAVAHYRIQPHTKASESFTLREHVRTIDEDERMSRRPPFDGLIQFQNGMASDIQAFGYDAAAAQPAHESGMPGNVWCLLRQDLYLGTEKSVALVVHWKHSLNAIRLLDVIPGDRTRLLSEPRTAKRKTG